MGMGIETQAKAARSKAIRFAAKRKEEYIGARVPKPLKEKIIAQAQDMNIPVSLLVRKALEKVFQQDNLATVIEDFVDHDTEKKPYSISAWSKIEAAQDCQCSVCQRKIPAGENAFLAIATHPDEPQIFCDACKRQHS